MDYRLVYDVTTAGPSLVGTIFFVIGAVITVITGAFVFKRDPTAETTAGLRKPHPPRQKPWGYFLFACAFTLLAGGLMYGDQKSLAEIAKRGECKLISGDVTQFNPLTGGKGSRESFTVDGVYFEYSDFMTTGAFNNSSRYGGPIKPNLAVRICYAPSERTGDNLILRLEVAS